MTSNDLPIPSPAPASEPTLPAVGTVPGLVIASAQVQSFTGPMPPPDYLRQYNEIVPGAAKDILDEFRANGAHQREMERLALTAATTTERRGQWIACGLVLVGFGLIMALALTQHDTVAGIVAGTLLGAVITGFVANRKSPSEKDTERKT